MWITFAGAEGESVRRVEGERFRIGTAEDCELRLEADGVGGLHATLRVDADGAVTLHDEGGGVFVDGEHVDEPVALNGNETIRVGEALLVLSASDPAAEPDEPLPTDPEAAIEELVAEEGAVVPARRRRAARAALTGLRDARRSSRVAIGLGAAAVLLAAVVLALAAFGVLGGSDDSAEAAAVTPQTIAEARDGAMLVTSEGRAGASAGSGVVIDGREGLVLTNFHVVATGDDLAVGKPGAMSDAELVAAAPCEDLALLDAEDAEGMRAIELGRQRDVRQGDPVVALGYPAGAGNGQKLVTTAGVVASVKTPLELPIADVPRFPNLVQTDASLAPGNSGGPLIGTDGRLVGINTALISEIGGQSVGAQGYALGVDRIRAIAADLRKGRSRGWFGAGLIFPPQRVLRRQKLPDGMIVTSAFEGTSAADERLEGSLVTEIDGRPLSQGLASYCDAAGELTSGDTRALRVISDPRRRDTRQVDVAFE